MPNGYATHYDSTCECRTCVDMRHEVSRVAIDFNRNNREWNITRFGVEDKPKPKQIKTIRDL